MQFCGLQFDPVSQMEAKADPRDIAVATYDLVCILSKERVQPEEGIPGFVQTLKSYLQANFFRPLTLKMLEDQTGFSRATLRRMFLKYYNYTPTEYISMLRLRHAEKLLLETNLSVKEIGYQCGFSSAVYFVAAFRKNFGCTPLGRRQKKSAG